MYAGDSERITNRRRDVMEFTLDTTTILWFVLLGLSVSGLHWMMAYDALEDLVCRKKVVGRWKAPWALAIILLTCLGPLVYIVFHFDIGPRSDPEEDPWYEDRWRIKRYK